MSRLVFRAVLALGLSACVSGGQPLVGHKLAERTEGPLITWDLFAEPIPEVPFPTDIATRPDTTATTGRRINASLSAPTEFERELRENMAGLDGWSTLGAIWIKFEAPEGLAPEYGRLDLENIASRQTGDTNFADDVALVIDVHARQPYLRTSRCARLW